MSKVWDAAKAVLRGNFVALKASFRNEQRLTIKIPFQEARIKQQIIPKENR